MVLLWISGAAKSGQWEWVGIPAEAQGMSPWVLVIGFFLRGMFVEQFDLMHLWFLHQLLVIYVLVLGLRWVLLRYSGQSGELLRRWDRQFRAVWSSRGAAYWWILPTVPLLMIMQSWGVDTPRASLIPELAPTLLYGLFFLVGWGLHRQPELLREPTRRWGWHLLWGTALVLPTRFLGDIFYESGLLGAYYLEIRLFHSCLYAAMMWSFVLGWMGLFIRYFPEANRFWRYVADSSYWIYLVHLPVVVGLQIWVALWPGPWLIKFGLINLAAFPVLFLSYHYLARSTFVGRQLNGRRRPFEPIFLRALRKEKG
jgi:peptidoglycan/LPS O-acetylase OafA/YrhL